MNDQTIPADDLRGFIARYRTAANGQGSILLDELEALLPTPPRPTLADMTEEERRACQWMQADVKDRGGRYVIANPDDGEGDAGMVSAYGGIEWMFPEYVTPRPDLPRMTWPGGDRKIAPAPTLPGRWRFADHPDHGRVIVTKTTPDSDGRVYVVRPAAGPLGHACYFCTPDELTYLDQEGDQ